MTDIQEQTELDRISFLEEFKKSQKSKTTLKYGLLGASLTAGATAATGAALLGFGVIPIPMLMASLPFLALPLFVPIIAGIAVFVISGFLIGSTLKRLHDDSQIYTDFYKEFESDDDGLFIDEDQKKKFEDKNLFAKKKAIKEWNSKKWSSNNKALKFWKSEDNLKEKYINDIFQAIKDDDRAKLNRLYDLRFFEFIKNENQRKNTKSNKDVVNLTIAGYNADSIMMTLLHLAAQNNHFKLAEKILENTTDPNLTNQYLWTPLQLAALSSSPEMVELLVSKGADVNVDNYGKTPLFLAINENENTLEQKINIAKVLLKNGADVYTNVKVTRREDNYSSADSEIIDRMWLRAPVTENTGKIFPEEITTLINDEIGKINTIFEHAGKGNLDAIKEMEEEYSYLLRIKDANGNSLLHIAAENNQKELVTELLENGADISAKNLDDKTPLDLAKDKDKDFEAFEEIVNLIEKESNDRDAIFEYIKQGDLDKLQKMARTNDYMNRIKNDEGNTLLHVAVAHEQQDVVTTMINIGSDINARNDKGQTPLHLAAQNTNEEIFEVLFENEANINATDKDGTTILHLAVMNNDKVMFNNLISKNVCINAKDIINNTALHYAVLHSNDDDDLYIVKTLLDEGASIDTKNSKDETALHVATSSNKLNIVDLLTKNKADVNAKNSNFDTPLHLAVLNRNIKMVKLVINRGANPKAANKDEKTPHCLAQESAQEVVNEESYEGSYNDIAIFIAANTPSVEKGKTGTRVL